MPSDMMILNAVRKDDEKITMNCNLPLVHNGDYHLVHSYAPELKIPRVKQEKLSQLRGWIETTFKVCEQLPLDNECGNLSAAARIYASSSKEDLLELIKWLDDPKDN